MLIVAHESIGEQNFSGQKHAAYACCTGEEHAKVWVSRFWQLGGRSWPNWCHSGKCTWQWLRNLVRAATTMDSWALSMAWTSGVHSGGSPKQISQSLSSGLKNMSVKDCLSSYSTGINVSHLFRRWSDVMGSESGRWSPCGIIRYRWWLTPGTSL